MLVQIDFYFFKLMRQGRKRFSPALYRPIPKRFKTLIKFSKYWAMFPCFYLSVRNQLSFFDEESLNGEKY